MKIDMAVSGKRKGRLNSTVLESLLALRLFCNNGKSAINMPVDLDETFSLLQQSGDDICAYCDRMVHGLSSSADATGFDEAIIIPDCGHLACQSCLPEYLEKREKCPTCNHHPASSNTQNRVVRRATNQLILAGQNQDFTRERYPTKLRALLEDILQNRSQRWYIPSGFIIVLCSAFILTSIILALSFQAGGKLLPLFQIYYQATMYHSE
jgi:hypothetical protein